MHAVVCYVNKQHVAAEHQRPRAPCYVLGLLFQNYYHYSWVPQNYPEDKMSVMVKSSFW